MDNLREPGSGIITELVDFEPDRVDGVESPANGVVEFVVQKAQDATDSVEKRDIGAAERWRLLREGKALPNGDKPPRFPIETREDLKNAIRTVGLTNAPKKTVRRFIERRARELGAEDLIPDKWKDVRMAKSDLGDGRGDLNMAAAMERLEEAVAAIAESVRQLQSASQLGTAQTNPDPTLPAVLKAQLDQIEAVVKEIAASECEDDRARERSSSGMAGGGTKPQINQAPQVGDAAKAKFKPKEWKKARTAGDPGWKKARKKYRRKQARKEKAERPAWERSEYAPDTPERGPDGRFMAKKSKQQKKNVAKNTGNPVVSNALAGAVGATTTVPRIPGSPELRPQEGPGPRLRAMLAQAVAKGEMPAPQAAQISRDATREALVLALTGYFGGGVR